jgi:hypothetical protein
MVAKCDYITKSKGKKKKKPWCKLENLFSLKIHYSKKLLIFASLETKKITNEYLLFENLRPKDCEISQRKNQKKSVAANSYKA